MKSIKCLIMVLILLLLFTSLSAADLKYVDIPFIQKVNGLEIGDPDKESLKLIVNGSERKIIAIKKVEKSLKGKCIHGREFLISFMSDSVCSGLRNTITYLITDVVENNDRLLILTPLKVYKIKVDHNKLRVIDNIIKLVTADCRKFSIMKSAIESELRQRIRNVYSILSKKNNFYNNSKNTVTLFQFLTSFPGEYKRYHELTTILDPEKLRKVVSLFEDSNAQKWWIHFNREDIRGITGEVRNLMEILGSAVNPLSSVKAINHLETSQKSDMTGKNSQVERDENYEMKTATFLKDLRKVIGYHEIVERSDLIPELLMSKICFNSIVFESEKGSVLKSTMRERSVPVSLLKRISLMSGGISIYAKDPEEMIRSVAGKDLGHYTLTFPLFKNENSLQIEIRRRSDQIDEYSYPEIQIYEFSIRIYGHHESSRADPARIYYL